jgi:hypothetical protein
MESVATDDTASNYLHMGSSEEPFFLGKRVARRVTAESLRGAIPCHLFAECPNGFQFTLDFMESPRSVS